MAVSGAASDAVKLSDQKASFQHKTMDSRPVEAIPPTDSGSTTLVTSPHGLAPSMRAASRISLGKSLK